MKSFVVFCCFGVLALVSAGSLPDQHMEMAKQLLKECQAQEGGTDNDFNTMISGGFSDTKEGRCMITCINEKVGVVSWKNGTFEIKIQDDKFFLVESSKMESLTEMDSSKCQR